jgi:hypothetical protein
MKKLVLILIILITYSITFAALPKNSLDCNTASIEGDLNNIIGCGVATNFGHTRTGEKDPNDNGQTFCNTKSEKEKYTYRSDRPKSENLNKCFVALRMKDVAKILKINVGNMNTKAIRKILGKRKNREAFCGKNILIVNKENGERAEAKLMDIMSNNDKVADLTGCVLNALGSKKGNPKVQITWTNVPTI